MTAFVGVAVGSKITLFRLGLRINFDEGVGVTVGLILKTKLGIILTFKPEVTEGLGVAETLDSSVTSIIVGTGVIVGSL